MSSSSDPSSLYTPLLKLAHLAPSPNAALPPHPRLQTSYPLLVSLTCSGFFNGMLKVSMLAALNSYILSRLILLTFYAFRNRILTYLSGFSALRSDRIHFRSGILSPDNLRASGGVVILFVWQGLFFFKTFYLLSLFA